MSEGEQVAEEKGEAETSKRMKTRKAPSATKRPPALSAMEPPKPQVQLTKTSIALNTHLKTPKHLEISQRIRPPCLKAKPLSFIKPELFPVKARPTTVIAPTISIAPKATALTNISVPTLTPKTIRELTTPPLRLKLKPPSDISVRPLICSEPVKDLGALTPIISPTHIVFQRPIIVSTPLERGFTVYLPKIRAISAIKEKIERVVYTLKRMGFSEEFIAECLKKVYGEVLGLNEILSIIEKGEVGQIEAMSALPKEVSDTINVLSAEKGRAVHVPKYGVEEGEPKPFESMIDGVFELIFEEKSGKGVGGAVKYSGESIYIVLEKPIISEHESLDTLHYLCIRALREYLGKEAETRALSSGYGRDEAQKYLGEREITIVDEKLFAQKLEASHKKVGEEELFLKVDEKALADRLKHYIGFRYVIFHVEPKKAELLYQKLWSLRSAFHDKIFWITPKPELVIDTVQKLAKVIWGFVDMPTSGSYDKIFGAGKVAYYKTLEGVSRLLDLKPPEKPYPIVKTHRLGLESREHLLIKKFLAKCLVDRPPEELALSKVKREERYDHIEFEKEWEKKNDRLTSDAYIESDKIAIEVETLFEEGSYGGEPVAKIRDYSVEKYKRHGILIRELWIVLENITLLNHIYELKGLHDLYSRWYKEGKINFQVKFLALDLKDERLVRMEELMNYLREILKDLHHNGFGWS